MGRAVWCYRWQTAGGTVAKSSFTTVANRRWTYEGSILEFEEESLDMALLDLIIDANFRSEQVGRVVVFPGDRRNRGYVVKSAVEEMRIRSFLKMFYFAHFSILSLGYLLAFEWSRELSYALGRQFAFLFRMGITLGFFSFVVGVPYWLLWRSYKRAFLSFVSVEDEVVLSGNSASRRHWSVSAVLVALGILMLFAAMLLVRSTSGAN
jgi:hypothetical protein